MIEMIFIKRLVPKPLLITVTGILMLILPANSFARDRLVSFDLGFTGAKRLDQFDWNIAGNTAGTNPNVLSELTWEDININEIGVNGRLVIIGTKSLVGGFVKGSANYGDIYSGENQDSDFEFDNRTGEWSRSNNQADHGETWDSQISGGPIFRSRNKVFSIAPQFGYSLHIQHLTIHNGYQTLSGVNPFSGPNPPPEGPIAGLNSTYDAEWRTIYLGLDLEVQPSSNFELYGGIEFHSGIYDAEADWNLRTDFRHPVSFIHESDEAYGFVTNAGLRFGLENILFHLEMRYRNFTAENGEDITYFDNGTVGATRVNEVNWESASIGGGITVRF